MDRYDIMQTLEMLYPNSSDKDENDAWVVVDETDGTLTVRFTWGEDEENDGRCKNVIALPIKDQFDEASIRFGQNNSLDNAMEVMAFYPCDYEEMAMFPDEVDDRVGTQDVVVRSVAELHALLEEVLAQDYTRFKGNR